MQFLILRIKKDHCFYLLTQVYFRKYAPFLCSNTSLHFLAASRHPTAGVCVCVCVCVCVSVHAYMHACVHQGEGLFHLYTPYYLQHTYNGKHFESSLLKTKKWWKKQWDSDITLNFRSSATNRVSLAQFVQKWQAKQDCCFSFGTWPSVIYQLVLCCCQTLRLLEWCHVSLVTPNSVSGQVRSEQLRRRYHAS